MLKLSLKKLFIIHFIYLTFYDYYAKKLFNNINLQSEHWTIPLIYYSVDISIKPQILYYVFIKANDFFLFQISDKLYIMNDIHIDYEKYIITILDSLD